MKQCSIQRLRVLGKVITGCKGMCLGRDREMLLEKKRLGLEK